MKRYLLLPLLLWGSGACAQTAESAAQREHAALLKENAELKATLARQHKVLAVGPNNQQVLVEVISCTASKRTKMATLALRVGIVESGEPKVLSTAVSLKGFPPMVAQLKELNFAFMTEPAAGMPAQEFTANLKNVPIVWKP